MSVKLIKAKNDLDLKEKEFEYIQENNKELSNLEIDLKKKILIL